MSEKATPEQHHRLETAVLDAVKCLLERLKADNTFREIPREALVWGMSHLLCQAVVTFSRTINPEAPAGEAMLLMVSAINEDANRFAALAEAATNRISVN